jgi:hypothetical protein
MTPNKERRRCRKETVSRSEDIGHEIEWLVLEEMINEIGQCNRTKDETQLFDDRVISLGSAEKIRDRS